ncbi:MAG: diaminopimelate epimerase [bacterium]|nr:diaminopimelate epimerase [bacterium]
MAEHTIQFIKMEGTANDYVFIDQLPPAGADRAAAGLPVAEASGWPADLDSDSPAGAALIQRIADRNRGVGGDGVVFIRPPEDSRAAARMRMYNADGSASAMCGNALRCIALHVHARTGDTEFLLESDVGLHAARTLEYDPAQSAGRFEVDLGPPMFAPERIPFAPERALSLRGDGVAEVLHEVRLDSDRLDSNPDRGELTIPPAVVLSMGNPHCVLFLEDADRAHFETLGPILENHPAFPERTNVEFVSPDPTAAAEGRTGLYQRTYERGSGETLSCGSGACAVHVAAVLTGRSGPVGRIRVRGGELELEWRGSLSESSGVLMRGAARLAFRGEFVV